MKKTTTALVAVLALALPAVAEPHQHHRLFLPIGAARLAASTILTLLPYSNLQLEGCRRMAPTVVTCHYSSWEGWASNMTIWLGHTGMVYVSGRSPI